MRFARPVLYATAWGVLGQLISVLGWHYLPWGRDFVALGVVSSGYVSGRVYGHMNKMGWRDIPAGALIAAIGGLVFWATGTLLKIEHIGGGFWGHIFVPGFLVWPLISSAMGVIGASAAAGRAKPS